jgi:hypothetical protein
LGKGAGTPDDTLLLGLGYGQTTALADGLPAGTEAQAFDVWVRPALARCILSLVSDADQSLLWRQVLEELGLPVGNAATDGV